MKRKRSRSQPRIRIPGAVIVVLSILPVISTALFYALRSNADSMDWVCEKISAPARSFMGMLSSIYPFSLMEVLCAAAGIWLIFYIVKSIVMTTRSQNKLNTLAKHLLTIAVPVVYIWSLYCWLWGCGYFAHTFAEKNDLTREGVSVADLTTAARLFAEGANEFAPQVKRNASGHFIEDRRDFQTESIGVFKNISVRYPSLAGALYQPKPMLFSWLMSRTGYTGIYFAITGESNINTQEPGFYLPATIAHELAHQNGVFAEDEANFAAIAACVTSDNVVYVYSGYLSGLTYLQNALLSADYDAWLEVNNSLCQDVKLDWRDNYEFWESQKTVTTGIKIVDSVLTSLTKTMSDTVDSIYDGYLKSQNQVLGLKSYGACVDMLVEHFVVSK